MTTKAEVEAWVEGYIQAWKSNDPEEIGRLFAADGAYYTGPFDAPWQGREAIVAGWLEAQDEPGTWRFEYEVVAADGPQGVMRGVTSYTEDPPKTYGNLWLISLDDRGQCTRFVEYWVKKRK